MAQIFAVLAFAYTLFLIGDMIVTTYTGVPYGLFAI